VSGTTATFNVKVRMRWRPLWRWMLMRIGCRLPILSHRAIVILANGLRYDISIGCSPWEIGGRMQASLGDPIAIVLTAEPQ
jgi:hypothetical protein